MGPDGAQALISDFLADLARLAADLGRFAATDAAENLARAVHSLQGVGLTLGLERLAGQCRALERAARAGDAEMVAQASRALPDYLREAETALREWLASAGLRAVGPTEPGRAD